MIADQVTEIALLSCFRVLQARNFPQKPATVTCGKRPKQGRWPSAASSDFGGASVGRWRALAARASRTRWRRASRPLPPGVVSRSSGAGGPMRWEFFTPQLLTPPLRVQFFSPQFLDPCSAGNFRRSDPPVLHPGISSPPLAPRKRRSPPGSSARRTSASLASREAWVLRGSDAPSGDEPPNSWFAVRYPLCPEASRCKSNDFVQSFSFSPKLSGLSLPPLDLRFVSSLLTRPPRRGFRIDEVCGLRHYGDLKPPHPLLDDPTCYCWARGCTPGASPRPVPRRGLGKAALRVETPPREIVDTARRRAYF